MKKTIAIDLDDTLCDFKGACKRALEKEPGRQYPQSKWGFYYDLQPIPTAKIYVDLLRLDFDVHILTRPSIKNLSCLTEKYAWVEKHFDLELVERTTCTSFKHKFEADYLIDDVLWKDFKGEQILFGTDPFLDWTAVYSYLIVKEGLVNDSQREIN